MGKRAKRDKKKGPGERKKREDDSIKTVDEVLEGFIIYLSKIKWLDVCADASDVILSTLLHDHPVPAPKPEEKLEDTEMYKQLYLNTLAALKAKESQTRWLSLRNLFYEPGYPFFSSGEESDDEDDSDEEEETSSKVDITVDKKKESIK